MKSYTDLEQSEKLAEILSIETADGTWVRIAIAGESLGVPEELQYLHSEMPFKLYSGIGIPSWSLAALVGVLPVMIDYKGSLIRLRMDKGNVGQDEYAIWYDDLDNGLSTNISSEAKNYIDVCYEIIIKLHELNLL